MINVNETHDPNLKSWIESANAPDTDFPIQNLPYCFFYQRDNLKHERLGFAIGDKILDFDSCWEQGLFGNKESEAYKSLEDLTYDFSLNRGVENLHPKTFSFIRRRLIEALEENASEQDRKIVEKNLLSISEVEFLAPFQIGDYTDFYCSIFHATNVGSMFRPDNPLLPNYKYVPIGYHGRASSIV